jgi:hypothetical protein
MGQYCCPPPPIVHQGEEKVRSVINSWKLPDYTQVKNILVKASENKEINIENLNKEVFSKLLNTEGWNNSKHYQKIFEIIQSKITTETVNIYFILFYLFPFIKFETNEYEKIVFFDILQELNEKNLTFIKFEDNLQDYYNFIVRTISQLFLTDFGRNLIENKDLYDDLNYLMLNVYTDNNIKLMVEKNIKTMKQGKSMLKDNFPISSKYFSELLQSFSFSAVRAVFIAEFEKLEK